MQRAQIARQVPSEIIELYTNTDKLLEMQIRIRISDRTVSKPIIFFSLLFIWNRVPH